MRFLATNVLWFLAPMLVVATIASNGGPRGTTAYLADFRALYCNGGTRFPAASQNTVSAQLSVPPYLQGVIGRNIVVEGAPGAASRC